MAMCTRRQRAFFPGTDQFSRNARVPAFPSSGIVQFYINNDDLYGMDFDDGENPDSFRVLFHPEVLEDEYLPNCPRR